jgi:GNAT superfamily N-acetyltransferase
MEKPIYPHSNMLHRGINLIFRKIPKQHKLHFMGVMLKKDLLVNNICVDPKGFDLKQAEVDEIKYIGEHPESLNYEVYKYRHIKGHICYCAKNQNEVMCYIWISPKVSGLFFGTENEVEILKLKDYQAYSYDLYTYEKYRHKGIASQIQNYTNLSLQKRGITERFNIIGPSFIASMKISLRAGFEPHRMVYVYGIKNFRKVFLGTTKSTNRLHEWKNAFKEAYNVEKRKAFRNQERKSG